MILQRLLTSIKASITENRTNAGGNREAVGAFMAQAVEALNFDATIKAYAEPVAQNMALRGQIKAAQEKLNDALIVIDRAMVLDREATKLEKMIAD